MNSSCHKPVRLTLSDGSSLQALIFCNFVLLRELTGSKDSLAMIGRAIFDSRFEFVDEVIATEVEICLAINSRFDDSKFSLLERLKLDDASPSQPETRELPIFFNESLEDWDRVTAHTSLSKSQYVEALLYCDLEVAMTGFIPGFIYIKGLPEELHVPRKKRPSTSTEARTFAIGGKYAGVYSLPSAAGWNCIGSIATEIFDQSSLPPVKLSPGDLVQIKPISKNEYQESASASSRSNCRTNRSIAEGRGTLVFEKPGLLSIVQDNGRSGLAWYAIPGSGPMDSTSADHANAIVGNPATYPVIECHYVAPRIKFLDEATICLTGAEMDWMIDGQSVPLNCTLPITRESILHGKAAKTGCRSYIAIHGRIDTTRSFGSASTYMPAKFGGNNGSMFRSGDSLQWVKQSEQAVHLKVEVSSNRHTQPLKLYPGPEFDWLDHRSKREFTTEKFFINMSSNRMGARLDGPVLAAENRRLSDSVPLLPGMIQLTPEGQLIVVLQDGQTTGGYPRVGYLDNKSVEKLNQIKIGHPFSFEMAE